MSQNVRAGKSPSKIHSNPHQLVAKPPKKKKLRGRNVGKEHLAFFKPCLGKSIHPLGEIYPPMIVRVFLKGQLP